MEFLKSVGLELKNSITPAVMAALLLMAVIGLVRLFAKGWTDNWIKTRFARSLESYKDELRRGTERELERHKDSLRRETEQRLANQKAELENIKSAYQAQLDESAAKHKAEMDRIAFEHQTTFSHLHQKRADVIEEVFRLLSLAELGFSRLAFPLSSENEPSAEEKAKVLDGYLNEFISYYRVHRIFLEKPLCGLIEQFINALFSGIINHNWWMATEKSHGDNESQRQAVEKVKELLPIIREEIEAEFRAILGVSNEERP